MPWYGELPERWEAQRIKNLFALRDERNFEPLSEVRLLSLYTAIGVKPHNEIERTTGNRAITADNYKKVYTNDIVVNIILCWQGAIGLSRHDGVTSPAYDVYRATSSNANVDYFNYLFRTPIFSGECYKAGRGIMAMRWRTYSDQFTAIHVPLPPQAEQDQIVRFLDWKVSGINKLINAKKKQIALLQEQKRAIINDAISQFGDVVRFRHVFTLTKGLTITKANLVESGIPCVSYGQIHSKYGFEVNPEIHQLPFVPESYLESNPQSLLHYGDFVFADTSEDIAGSGNFTYLNSNTPVFAGYHTIIARTTKKQNNRYIAYYLDSPKFRSQIQQKVNGVKVYSITRTKLNSTFIVMPCEDEQKHIVIMLDESCYNFARLIEAIRDEITLLNEYRTCLISDVVTGRMDVRGVAIPHHESVEEAADTTDEELEDTEGDNVAD